ncbi:MAG: Ig-like domain-containing domain [Paludibacter sp.]|nr:Ig-like domain-containing domain [Paludibacter sp.]
MKNIVLIIAVFIGLVVYSCANKAQGPTGGPKDETPPKVMKSTPLNGALNFKKKEVHIVFDENISIEKATENVIISPPQLKQPEVKGNGKTVTVQFMEELLDSTTYTINFGNSIVDLNEKNALKDYRFSFSTGNEIDTLRISGTLINADDLNPVSNVVVGIYREDDDSVFFVKPFLRIAKTNENGRFTIDNIKAGKYKIFALGDINQDYFYQQGENVAMLDSMITPTFRIEQMQDTIWKDSTVIDSVRTFMGTRYLPDDIVLRYFKESKKRQSLLKNERKISQSFSLFFNTTLPKLPEIKPINFEWEGKYILQKNNTLDSLTYWITDSVVYARDTLEMAVTYLINDVLSLPETRTDTISVIMRRARVNPKAKQPSVKQIVAGENYYKFTTNLSGTFDVYKKINLLFEAPLATYDLTKINLSQKVDTILKPLMFIWKQTDSTLMKYSIDYKWEPEKMYVLKIDSAAFYSMYKNSSDKFSNQFKITSLDEYSSIKVMLAEFDSTAIIQVLDNKDVVVNSKPALKKGVLFEHLKPGDYFLRMYLDKNKNGKWDTGYFLTHNQPEEVIYYPKKLSLRANWEFEETWDFRATPLLKQKPAELRKDGSKKTGNY